MMRLFLIVCALLFITAQNVALAEQPAPIKLSKEQIDQLGKIAHEALPNADIGEGELIGEERAKTLVYPLVPYNLMEFVIVRGNISGIAAHCGINWQEKFFAPLMQTLRAKEKDFTNYQWAFVGILHGVSMASAERNLKDKPCSERMKENLLKLAQQ